MSKEFIKNQLRELKENGFDWKKRILQTASKPHARFDGKDLLLMCSNNYLGLTNHPKLKEASIKAVEKYGAGSGSVRVISGTMDLHVELEEKLAKFKGTQSSLIFQTGFAANAGSIPQLAGEGDLIISDELNHGSIIDGVRLSKAERKVYTHKNMEELERVLKESKGKFKNILIATDGVFSMDGDIAPLDEIAELAHRYDAMTYVDDAHGDGVLGKNGKGIIDHFHVHGKIDIEMGTFSKAFGVVGGYVAADQEICEFLWNKARTFLLSGSHPPAVVAACIAALEVIEEEPELVKTLWSNTKYYKKELQSLGFDIGVSETPITPLMIGDSVKAQQFSKELYKAGILALPIVFPMVAKDKARIRTIVTAAHSKEDLDFALSAFEKAGKKLEII